MIGSYWGLLALLSLPIIAGIHLFRHRFLPHRLAGLYLWSSPGRDPTAGRRLHRIENTVSLILELLLGLALSLYLLDLRWGATAGAEHRVIVLDATASMSAREGDVDTAARAREAVLALIRDVGRAGQVSLIVSGPEPSLLAGPAAPAEEAARALERWTPGARAHAMAPALDLARELAGPRSVVHVVSDRLPAGGELRRTASPLADADGKKPAGTGPAGGPTAPPAGRLHWHAVGRALSNTAILATRRERTERAEVDRVFVRLGLFGAFPRGVTLSLRSGERKWDERTVTMNEGVEKRLTFEVPAGDAPVEVLLSDDPLAADNRAILLRPPRRPVRCAVVLPEGEERTAVEGALRALPDILPVAAGEPADLVFAPADHVPAGLPDAWSCRIGPPSGGPASAAPEDEKSFLGPFVMEQSHPLLAGVHLGGVTWGGSTELTTSGSTELPPGGADAPFPLVSAGARTLVALFPAPAGGMDLLLNLRLKKSNLHRTPDWPILLSNLVRLRREAFPGVLSANVRVGDALAVNLPRTPARGGPGRTAGPVRLILPDGSAREIPGRGRVVLTRLEKPGVYRVMEGEREFDRFAANFQDAAASDLTAAATAERAPEGPGGPEELRRAEALVDPRSHFPLLLIAVVLFFADAFVVRRGETAGETRNPKPEIRNKHLNRRGRFLDDEFPQEQ